MPTYLYGIYMYYMNITELSQTFGKRRKTFGKLSLRRATPGVEILNVNTLRLRQNGRYFTDNIFKWIFLKENVWISIEISLNYVPKGPINNIPALVRIMAWQQAIIWTIDG